MKVRRAAGNVLVTLIIVAAGIIIGVLVYQWSTASAPSHETTYQASIRHVYFNAPVSVGNAKWEIQLLVSNSGGEEFHLRNVYLNRKPVDVYGLSQGDSLPDRTSTGTSLLREGIIMKPGETTNIQIWIGSSLYGSGSQISVHIVNPNILSYTRNVTLK